MPKGRGSRFYDILYINTLCFRLPPPPSGTPPSRRRRASDTFVLTHLPLYHSDTLHFQPAENPLFPADRPPARKRASDFQHTAHAQKDSEILTNKIEIKPFFPRQKKRCFPRRKAMPANGTSIVRGPHKHCGRTQQALRAGRASIVRAENKPFPGLKLHIHALPAAFFCIFRLYFARCERRVCQPRGRFREQEERKRGETAYTVTSRFSRPDRSTETPPEAKKSSLCCKKSNNTLHLLNLFKSNHPIKNKTI